MNASTRLAILAALAAAAASVQVSAAPSKPPEFTHDRPSEWLNSQPLKLAQLKGKVVLVEFWAFECDNCIKSRPWVEQLERDDAGSGLVVIAVHTPELRDEHNGTKLREAVKQLGIHDPVMIDEDGSYWRAMKAQYWPTWCLIGRDGMLAAACVPGEMDLNDARSSQVRDAIDAMLKAPAP